MGWDLGLHGNTQTRSSPLMGVELPHADFRSNFFSGFLGEKVVHTRTGMRSEGEGFLPADLDALVLDLMPKIHEIKIGNGIFPGSGPDAVADMPCVIRRIRAIAIFADSEHSIFPCSGSPSQMRHNHYAREA